jgi:hypothetical protein
MWRQAVLPKRRWINTKLRSASSQKIVLFMVTVVRTSNPTFDIHKFIVTEEADVEVTLDYILVVLDSNLGRDSSSIVSQRLLSKCFPIQYSSSYHPMLYILDTENVVK